MPWPGPGDPSAVVSRAAHFAGVPFSSMAIMSGRPFGMIPVTTGAQPSRATQLMTVALSVGGFVPVASPVRLSISRYAVTGRETVVRMTKLLLSRLSFIVATYSLPSRYDGIGTSGSATLVEGSPAAVTRAFV